MKKTDFMGPVKLGLIGIMKNESLNLSEWLDHYFWIGVDIIFLIDNGSTDNSVKIAKGHKESDRIFLIRLPERHKQKEQYRSAFEYFNIKKRCEWLMIADLDEFWFEKSGKKLTDLLEEYDGIDVIYANWTVFGSSNKRDHPKNLRNELLLRRPRLGGHRSTKWICRLSALRHADQLHVHKIHRVDSSKTISDNVNLQINHYVTQSEYYFEKVKMSRGDVLNEQNDKIRDWSYFENYNRPCTIRETLLRDLIRRETAQGDFVEEPGDVGVVRKLIGSFGRIRAVNE